MYLMYADESGNTGTDYDNSEQPIFVLAGVLLEDKSWHKINDYFTQEKNKIWTLFNKNEIHTSEIFNPRRNSIFRRNHWIENLETLQKLVDLVCQLDITVHYIAIDKKFFKKGVNFVFKNALKIEPYIYSFGILYDKISKILSNNKEKGIVFLDDILTIPSQLHNIYPILSHNNSTMIEEAIFVKSNCSNFIQIADIFAFYIERYFSIERGYKNYGEIKNKHCLDMYKKLSTKINTEASELLTNYLQFKPKEYYT